MAQILLIEPDLTLGKVYLASLQEQGHTVTLCRHAESGILAIDTQKPDLILLELELPEHGGIEFLHELRSYPEWQQIPIVLHTLLSPWRMTQHLERLRTMGVIGYLYKPAASLRQMVRTVNQALAK